MLSARPPSPWFVVWFGFAVLSLAYSTRALLGLTMPVWDQAGLWSRGWSSMVGSVALVAMAVCAPILGLLLARIGLRTVCITGLLILAAASGSVAATSQPWMFMLAFGLVGGIGFGVLSFNVISTAVAWDFHANRGLATGIATAGSTAGQFCLVPVAAAMISIVSWRWSFLGLALLCTILIPLACRLPGKESANHLAPTLSPRAIADDLLQLVRSRVFHTLFWSFAICGYTTSGVIETHLLPYASFCGIPPVPSATAYGVLSVVNFFGMIAAGWLTDRFNRPRLLAAIYFLRVLAFIVLLHIGASFEVLLIFSMAFGAVDYSTVPVTISLAASHLGLRRLGLVVGLITAAHQLGGALGALLGGLAFDLFQSYGLVWQSSAVLALIAGLLALSISDERNHPAMPAAHMSAAR